MSSFSPERWTNVVLLNRTVEGSVYGLPWRYSVVQYYPITVIIDNENHLDRTLCKGALSLDKENRDAFIQSTDVSRLVHMS